MEETMRVISTVRVNWGRPSEPIWEETRAVWEAKAPERRAASVTMERICFIAWMRALSSSEERAILIKAPSST